MTSLDHRVKGVDHAAFPTFDPAGTVHFYRDVLGFPVVHSICAVGWGPEDHPDFIHFYFDIGNDDRIAFFYYFGAEAFNQTGRGDAYAAFGPEVPLYMVEITRAMRPVTPAEDLDANLTIDALLDVVAEPGPSLAKLLARKAELIVERAAQWELAHAGDEGRP
jgi:catechol 2,3-dioxygenase-like lactoylglutathione lyase family enzyme